jgi:hypothetical protein
MAKRMDSRFSRTSARYKPPGAAAVGDLNITNTPIFNVPGSALGTPTFG